MASLRTARPAVHPFCVSVGAHELEACNPRGRRAGGRPGPTVRRRRGCPGQCPASLSGMGNPGPGSAAGAHLHGRDSAGHLLIGIMCVFSCFFTARHIQREEEDGRMVRVISRIIEVDLDLSAGESESD